MSDSRLHEIMAQVSMIHKTLLEDGKIDDLDYVTQYLDAYESDIKEHYLTLLLQYYFQKNDIKNFKELLLLGFKFDLRMNDIKEAFLNIKTNEENVIEFLEDNVVFFKDTNYEEPLFEIYEYYQKANEDLKVALEESLELIRRNRYVCAFAYKNKDQAFAKFFINEDLLKSLSRDLPYLLK
ncbi:hypothetical protein [Halarcobacter ebronensis]|uniref:Uncharacterized protein n=1 Tax=Halarcobacter ebronensis TaxID=1462615 RepID=A0A4Q1AYZ9_9BACT|nr:hypothetical protein [Halarcobacter ebronensis]QKF82624.1 hypothetical protein AEBR_2147 [Halarcobacter ebronensis]RXK07368.1 hypothetical protein CRV07_02575 [Halarcobacter ebronensis]